MVPCAVQWAPGSALWSQAGAPGLWGWGLPLRRRSSLEAFGPPLSLPPVLPSWTGSSVPAAEPMFEPDSEKQGKVTPFTSGTSGCSEILTRSLWLNENMSSWLQSNGTYYFLNKLWFIHHIFFYCLLRGHDSTHLFIPGLGDTDPRFKGDDGVRMTGGQDLLTQTLDVL